MTRTEYAARPRRESLRKRLGSLALRIDLRDGHACVYCHATAETSGAALHLDHLLPRCAGGLDVPENLVVACRSCNSARQALRLAAWCRLRGLQSRTIRAQARRVLPVLARAA